VSALVGGAQTETEWPGEEASGGRDLISVGEIAALLGLDRAAAARRTRAPDFPSPALVAAERRLWLREDVLAYVDGRPVPRRLEGELPASTSTQARWRRSSVSAGAPCRAAYGGGRRRPRTGSAASASG